MAAVAPRLPKLAPDDMAWVRWVTSQVQGTSQKIGTLDSRITASNKQRASVAGNVAKGNSTSATNPFAVEIPSGQPQTPTAPTLGTDHGTVTIRWDGNIVTDTGVTGSPAIGFDYATLERSLDGNTWATIGNRLGIAGTVVDTDVIVGTRYYYRLYSTDTLGAKSTVSGVSSISVKGVDLGSLDQDVLDALDDIRHSATTGGLIAYSDTPPSGDKWHVSTSIWFDTSDPNGAVPNRWDTTTNDWVPVPYGEGALGPGSITASKILAGAIDTYHLGASIVTTEKLESGSVVTDKMAANSVTTNKVAAGAIDADRLAVGAVTAKAIALTAAIPSGNGVSRVPRPLTDSAYWSQVIAGTIPLGSGPTRAATATNSGILLAPTSTQYAGLYVTTKLPVPESRAIHLLGTASSTNVNWLVRYYDTSGNFLNQTFVAQDSTFNFDKNVGYYEVVIQSAETTPGTYTVSSLQVFEIIGTQVGSKQAAQLSPSGLRLYNDAGQLSVDISTSTKNFFTILNDADEAVLTLNEDGNGNFNAIQANDDFYFQGQNVVGDFADYTRTDGGLDGALLNRLPRGVHYASTWGSMHDFVIDDQYQRIATGSFSLNPNRSYTLETNLSGIQARNDFGINCYVELQLATAPLTSVTSGTVVARSVVFSGDSGYWQLEPAFFTTPAGAGFSTNNCTLPANTDIYWQINTNLGSAPTQSSKLAQYAYNPTFRVIDQGPVIPVLDGTDRSVSGGTATGGAGSGSGGNSTGSGSSTTKSQTKTWTASWSASWNDGGNGRVSGSGTYTDANKLYQGYGASNMGAKFGFPASVQSTLAGKTITKVEVFIQNRWTYYNAGGTATFKYHGNSSAGSTYGSDSGGSFNRAFDRGQGRWLTIGNTEVPFSAWKSGSARGLAMVVQGGVGNYSYYDGVGKSKPPQLRITYK
jgi:hypothetical protein